MSDTSAPGAPVDGAAVETAGGRPEVGPAGGSAPRDVLVVVPALNEERSVGDVVRGLVAAGYDCAVVDDGSTDATAAVARAAGAEVLRLPYNLGVGGALRCGFRYAVQQGYQRVVQCDADGQHPPEQVGDLLRTQEASGAHLVIGSRFVEGAGEYEVGGVRRRTMRLLSWMVRRSGGVTVHDTTSGFRCIAQPLLGQFARSYPVHYLGDTFEALLAAGRGGYRVVELPVGMRERAHGTSSVGHVRSAGLVTRLLLVTVMRIPFQIRPLSETASRARAAQPPALAAQPPALAAQPPALAAPAPARIPPAPPTTPVTTPDPHRS